MTNPFIQNHQFNAVTKQAKLLLDTLNTVADRKIIDSIRAGIEFKFDEIFPLADAQQLGMLKRLSALQSSLEIEGYLRSLEPLREPFQHVTESQLKKLFPKNKKLKMPDLASLDYHKISYLGWTDIATNKLFIVYSMNGQLVGVEGRYTPSPKKGTCFLCNRHSEAALFTAVTKSKPAGASPDYYKAIGNYLCTDSTVCNQNITDVFALEQFIERVNRK